MINQEVFDNIDKWAKEQGASGLAYFSIEKNKVLKGKGPIGKFFSEASLQELIKITKADIETVFFFPVVKRKRLKRFYQQQGIK